MAEQLIDRRHALKYAGLLTATAAGREFLARWLPSASDLRAMTPPGDPAQHHAMRQAPPQIEPAGPYVPQFFKPHEFETIEILAEMIIPTDDQPGAKEARVADYIDFVVFSAAEHLPGLQQQWTGGLARLDQASQERFGRTFRDTSPANREALLTGMSLPERAPGQTHPGFAFYRLVKEMTVEGFYTSRIGLLQVLEYQGLAFLAEFPGCTHPEHQ